MGSIKTMDDLYLVFETNFIATIKYVGTFEELKKQGYKRPVMAWPVMAFYTDETKLYEIVDIWHLSLKDAPIFYKEYEVGYITHFDNKHRSNLSKMRTEHKKNIIDQLFGWSSYGFI